jgi:hypothetical protein
VHANAGDEARQLHPGPKVLGAKQQRVLGPVESGLGVPPDHDGGGARGVPCNQGPVGAAEVLAGEALQVCVCVWGGGGGGQRECLLWRSRGAGRRITWGSVRR